MPGPRAVFQFYNGCLLGLIAACLGFEPDENVIWRAKFLKLGGTKAQAIYLAAQFIDVGGLFGSDR